MFDSQLGGEREKEKESVRERDEGREKGRIERGSPISQSASSLPPVYTRCLNRPREAPEPLSHVYLTPLKCLSGWGAGIRRWPALSSEQPLHIKHFSPGERKAPDSPLRRTTPKRLTIPNRISFYWTRDTSPSTSSPTVG